MISPLPTAVLVEEGGIKTVFVEGEPIQHPLIVYTGRRSSSFLQRDLFITTSFLYIPMMFLSTCVICVIYILFFIPHVIFYSCYTLFGYRRPFHIMELVNVAEAENMTYYILFLFVFYFVLFIVLFILENI